MADANLDALPVGTVLVASPITDEMTLSIADIGSAAHSLIWAAEFRIALKGVPEMPPSRTDNATGSTTAPRSKSASRAVVCLTCCALLAGLFLAAPVSAQESYTFTRIADTTSTETTQINVFCVGMNNHGTVIFTAGDSTPGVGPKLWRGDGQTPAQEIAQDVTTICASINDAAQFAYGKYLGLGVGALVRHSGGVETTMARSDASPFFGQTYLPAINASGNVLFHGYGGCAGGYVSGIYVAPAGPTIYDCTDFVFDVTQAVSMNDAGVVVFTARSVADQTISVYRGPGTVPLVANTGTLTGAALAVINNANAVAFTGTVNGESALYSTVDGVAITRVSNPMVNFQSGNLFSINDSGAIAYEAGDPTGMGAGIYLGPGSALKTMIGPGDELDGSIVRDARLWPESLNENGQIAFFARLQDGREGVYRADPTDTEPPTVTAPGSITVPATEAGGTRGSASSALATFLAGGTATDGMDPAPQRLSPQVTGVDADNSTLFPLGTTQVAFRFQDVSGNVGTATAGVEVTAPALCAVDVTSSMTFSDGRLQQNRKTGNYILRVRLTIANDGPATITGPVSLVLDGLPAGVTLQAQQGTTSCASPASSPYVSVNIGADNAWSRKERVAVELEFASSSTAITFTRRVLAGPGPR